MRKTGTMRRESEPLLVCRGLAVGYGKRSILPPFDLELSAGDILALIGPNGAGKSTILNTVTGELPPIGGEILVGGRALAGLSQRERAERVAAVYTERPRPAYMSCLEVVQAGRYPYTSRLGRMSDRDVRAAEDAIAAVRAQDYADRPFDAVSDGQRQRILIARALAQEPELLVLDEPTAWLDVRYRREIMTLLQRCAAEREMAILLSLHETELAAKTATKLLCVTGGGCVAERPEKLRDEAFLADIFDMAPPGGETPAERARRTPFGTAGGGGMGAPLSAGAADTRPRCLMIQGTMSGVGKSLLAAGFCRLFRQDGYAVAPFKSQNMALNSFVTDDGLEIGRAQALQAEAAGIAPDVRMNPVLLKPTGEHASQVIVNGRVRADMDAASYFSYKKELFPEVLAAYQSLREEYDLIVIEGAGSPAEINLKENDIVNMGLARAIGAPVLLAGDIDRGGVFAQLYGTLALLSGEERALVKGLLINRFRGDIALLAPGLSQIEALTGTPVLGTVPYLRLNLDEEDSLARLLGEERPAADDELDIAVIALPHISNFTDFQILRGIPGVHLRFVRGANLLGVPDLTILPGTKNTLDDLRWLRESGIAGDLLRAQGKGGPVLGICGGFQMLGRTLCGSEGAAEATETDGLGLLPMRTTFESRKTRTRARGRIAAESGLGALAGAAVEGYEIHMGTSIPLPDAAEGEGVLPLFLLTDARTGEQRREGLRRGNVCGTYLHGLFDDGATTGRLLRLLADRRGLAFPAAPIRSRGEEKERQLNLLAETLRACVDMDAVYRMMGGKR